MIWFWIENWERIEMSYSRSWGIPPTHIAQTVCVNRSDSSTFWIITKIIWMYPSWVGIEFENIKQILRFVVSLHFANLLYFTETEYHWSLGESIGANNSMSKLYYGATKWKSNLHGITSIFCLHFDGIPIKYAFIIIFVIIVTVIAGWLLLLLFVPIRINSSCAAFFERRQQEFQQWNENVICTIHLYYRLSNPYFFICSSCAHNSFSLNSHTRLPHRSMDFSHFLAIWPALKPNRFKRRANNGFALSNK